MSEDKNVIDFFSPGSARASHAHVRPSDARVRLVDLFRDIELQRRGSTRP
jgi:hypothetical protein